MTENKLGKFISKPREPPSGKRTHQPIILTDSKGNYLKKYACHDVEKQIVWLPKSGAKIEDSTQWLKSNISKKIINYGDISGADPGFGIRGGVSRRGIWGPLKVPSGSRAEP
jgi:hypothetical protein